MSILLAGGTGTTGVRVARLLEQAGLSAYITTRSPEKVAAPHKGIKFDWLDQSTWETPFTVAASAGDHIDAVYLVPPYVDDMSAVMNPFIDLARERGVKRFVLVSAALVNKGDPTMGGVHEHLDKLGVDYCALRPSWFQDNFQAPSYVRGIVKEGAINSAAQDGRLAWISADDIADAAFNALTSEKIDHRELLVLGPELLSYDEVAATFTEVLGRPIVHKRVSEQEVTAVYVKDGLPESVGAFFAYADTLIAKGADEALTKLENKFVGRRKIRDYITANKDTWSQQ